MNVKARVALAEVIAKWAIEHELSPEEEIQLLEKHLAITKEAVLVAAHGFDPEER